MADNIKRVPYPEHPNRCQAIGRGEQCMMFAVEGGSNCNMHGGNKQLASIEAASLRNYNLTKFRAQLERHSNSDHIKSLRDEVGILRMMMETRLNKCHDEMDLMLQSGPIADLVLKIDRLVTSCHKLEGSMGELMDKTAVIQFANVIIGIIGEVLSEHPEELNIIAERILSTLHETGGSS